VSTFSVLVIDDSTADFDLIDLSIQTALGSNVTLHHALSMDQAAEKIRENDYSLILHDLYLPPWGPESIVETYKIARDTPIIAMSGTSSADLHRTALSNGAKLFCSKSDMSGGNVASILGQVVPEIRQS
jgi:CheY-like chemotaxis protein